MISLPAAALALLVSMSLAACDDDQGPCTGEGQLYDARDDMAECCEGLVSVTDLKLNFGEPLVGTPEGCMPGAPPNLKLCVPCGDGSCDPDENYCNCPSDCERP